MYRIGDRHYRYVPATGAHSSLGFAGSILFRAVIGQIAWLVNQSRRIWPNDFRLAQPPRHPTQGEIHGDPVHRNCVWRVHNIWRAPICDCDPSNCSGLRPDFYLDTPRLNLG